jgi:hypothetical protein
MKSYISRKFPLETRTTVLILLHRSEGEVTMCSARGRVAPLPARHPVPLKNDNT